MQYFINHLFPIQALFNYIYKNYLFQIFEKSGPPLASRNCKIVLFVLLNIKGRYLYTAMGTMHNKPYWKYFVHCDGGMHTHLSHTKQ